MSDGDRMLEIKRLKVELEQLKENQRNATMWEVKGREAIAEADRLEEELELSKTEAHTAAVAAVAAAHCRPAL